MELPFHRQKSTHVDKTNRMALCERYRKGVSVVESGLYSGDVLASADVYKLGILTPRAGDRECAF